ncbi:MAG: alpha/beta hydrolase [Deltaproteobacteria bacterium]|nr:alpha/beta hydrolase [Deltaproteobacteria bacterium]
MKIKVGDVEINYEVSGEGKCLVLIHGFSDNLTMWYNQVPVFNKQFKVLTYDVRGHGKTEMAGEGFSMELFADDLFNLLETLDIKEACIVGYSMGGRIGLEFAIKHPEMTTGLVLANSGVMGPDVQLTPEQMAGRKEHRQRMMDLVETGKIEIIADTMAENSLSPGFKDREPAVFQRYKEVKMQNDPTYYPKVMQGTAEAMANPPDLTKLKCPTLIIAGEYDGIMGEAVITYMAEAIKDVTVKVLSTGHASAIEAPEAFNQAVLDFVNKL